MERTIATVVGFALASSFALAPALAKLKVARRQEYAARKTVARTGRLSEASYEKACLARERTSADPGAKGMVGVPEGRDDPDTDLAKKVENPIADLISVPFNNYSTFNYGGRGTFNLLEIQPVIPFHLTPDWNVITRTVLPVVWTPDLSPVPTVPVGVAPTDFSAFLTPKNETNGWLWGVGPVVQTPTISSADLGSNVWGGGPTAIVVHTGDKIVGGALVNSIWSFGGTKGLNRRPCSSRSSTTISGTGGSSTVTRTSSLTGRLEEPNGP
jgi:hypothetical protein